MTYPAPVLPDLLVGWQKVADRYNMPIYVFQTRGHIPRGLERGSRRGAPSGHPGPPGDVRTRSRHCLGRSRLQGSVDRIALRANEDPGPHCPRRSPGERVEVGYREGRSDIAQGPGAAIGDRLIVGDAVTSPT